MYPDIHLLVVTLVFWMSVFVLLGLIFLIDQVQEVKNELRKQHNKE